MNVLHHKTLQKEGYKNSNFKNKAGIWIYLIRKRHHLLQKKDRIVFLVAAIIGGIKANNNYPADFIYENLMIQTNIIHSAYLNKVKVVIFGQFSYLSKIIPQPIKEEYLLSSDLEPTNKAYSMAK